MNIDTSNYVIARQRHPLLCKWWMRTREIPVSGPPWTAPVEFFVPWWAWPLELAHQAVFGYPRLKLLDGDE